MEGEIIECNDCGFVGPNEDNGLCASSLMDELEAGGLTYDAYSELMAGTRYACPECSSLNTEIPL